MFLGNNSSYPIGLDISDLSLKLVQLNKIRDKIKIQAISRLNLPKGAIIKGEIKNPAVLTKAIKKIISAPVFGKVSSKDVVACLPESKTFIKLIEVQKSPNSLADIIGSEIEKHVPLSLLEIYYDWQIIEETPQKYLILIGAAPKDIVNQYTSLLDQTKLSPVALEIEPVAVARCLLKEECRPNKQLIFPSKDGGKPSLNYGLIDIGADHTSMIFYSRDTILFTVSMPISGEEITSQISRALNLTKEQAEKAKIICGLDETKADGAIKDILSVMLKNLISKIKEALQYYGNYFPERGPLNKIFLCGGGANIINLTKIIGRELSGEIKIADALINLNENKEKFNEFFTEKHNLDLKSAKLNSEDGKNNLSVKQSSDSTFATAIGLALRGIVTDEI